jgi:hypothetical protein
MTPYISDISCRLIAVASLIFCITANFGSTADPPRPTPRPGTLAAYAQRISLDRSNLADGDGRVILTNDSVAGLAAGGSITLGTVKKAKRNKPNRAADNAERSRWQAAHSKQREVIADLERRRARLELEIDQINSLSLTAKTMVRLEKSEAKLHLLNRDIAAERAELARIVRNARRRGAEPGWFR